MNIANRIKEIIIEQLRVNEEDVLPNASFTDDLGADSLAVVELIMAFEGEFGTQI
ncbi:MAG: acyl carrier protein, partial [Acinetobacter junii]